MTSWTTKGLTLLLAGLLLCELFFQLRTATSWGHDSWQMGDWLIHYGEGFVRRGFAGSAVRWISGITGWQANHVVIGISLMAFIGLGLWMGFRAKACFSTPYLLSSLMLGFPVYQEGVVRKDACLLLLLIAGLALMAHGKKWRGWKWPAVVIVAMVAILIHEAFLFFGLPCLLLAGLKTTRDGVKRLLIFLPVFVCGLAVVLHHGSPDQAAAIHESWRPLWEEIENRPVPSEPASAIAALGWSPAEGRALVAPMWAGIYQPMAWAAVFLMSASLLLAFTRKESRAEAMGWGALLLGGIAPLFILGTDYGRWIFFWSASVVILVATRTPVPWGVADRLRARIHGGRIEAIWDLAGKQSWVLLLLGLPLLWSIEIFTQAGPLPRFFFRWIAW